MMGALHSEGGADLRVEIMEAPEVEDFIDTHAGILDSSFEQVEMSPKMRESLQQSDRIFSGFKAFCELGEAFPSLIDENGNKKPFNQFLNDVKKIDETYNERYLRAEYNFAEASGYMAGKWEDYAADGDDYYLQYRTANDGQVRPEHAALHGVTLPAKDSFWDAYYPPNGWNCRCTVIQVLKREAEPTPHDEAMRLGGQALAKDRKGMFRFNPGKHEKIFPDYNPYTISKCTNCTKKLSLAQSLSDNELCAACPYIRTMCGYEIIQTENGRVRVHNTQTRDEREQNIDIATYLANKHGYRIDLTPVINNVRGHKNADSFNHTLGCAQEYKVCKTPTYNAVDKLIKKASKQANSIVIKIDVDMSLGELSRVINSRIKRYENVTDITIIRNSKDKTYQRSEVISDGFKIRKEDFK